MSELRTSETSEQQTVKCEGCGKTVVLYRELDGVNRPRFDRPFRYPHHAGNKWGRPCKMNGEQYMGDES